MKKKIIEEESTFGTPIDNGNTSNLKESINEMQSFLDEPYKTRGRKGYIIAIIILIIIISIVGTDWGYIRFFKKDKNNTVSIMEKYSYYLNNIKDRKYAEFISFDDEEDSIEYVLGSDNNLYLLDDEDEITIPGAKGNGGEFKGKKLNISNVVRMYKVNHTDGTGEIEDESLGLLLIKEDGKISIIRHPEKDKTKEEILDNKYIVDVYTPVDNISKTVLIDIDGNTHILK